MKKLTMTVLILLSSTLFAQESLTWKALMSQYQQTKLEQFDADDNLHAFAAYLAAHPDDALAQLYTASSYCFVGRDAWMPWNKMNAVNKCIDKMETAFINTQKQYPAQSSQRLNSYLTFGLTNMGLPTAFGQHELAVESLKQARTHPAFEYLPNDLKEKVISSIKE